MNLLMVSPHVPNPSWGAGTRSYYLLKALTDTYAVSLLALQDSALTEKAAMQKMSLKDAQYFTLSPSTRQKRVKQILSLLQGKSYLLEIYNVEALQKEMDLLLSQNSYDAVIFESVYMAGLRVPPGLPIIIDQHNIEAELLQRTYQREKSGPRKWYNWWESRKLKPIELERCRKAQGVLVTSERECLLLKRLAPECIVEVVPNGVDTAFFDALERQQKVANRIIFTGTMNYYPNIDAVLFFARECWPLIRAQVPTATWQIVGKSPPPEVLRLAELPGVTVTGAVPDVRPYIASASVAIAPLQIGSGTRLKILEALAMRKAVVSTSLGCEGLAVQAGKHLLVADQAQTFAQAVVNLLRSTEKRTALGNAGRVLVEAEYSWKRCGDTFIRALEKMVR